MVTPAEDPQVHGRGPGRVSLSDSSGTEGEKSDSYQVFPDYSQLVPDRTEPSTHHNKYRCGTSTVPVLIIDIMSARGAGWAVLSGGSHPPRHCSVSIYLTDFSIYLAVFGVASKSHDCWRLVSDHCPQCGGARRRGRARSGRAALGPRPETSVAAQAGGGDDCPYRPLSGPRRPDGRATVSELAAVDGLAAALRTE